jgi:hypothetical protein
MSCTNARERHDCDQRAVRSAVLEDQVGAWVEALRFDDWRADMERLQRREARPAPAVDAARIERQMNSNLALYKMGDVSREEYVARKRELEASLEVGRPQSMYPERVLADAARLLSDLGNLWAKATPSQRGEIAQGLFAEIDVLDDRIVGARLARPEYLPLIASATLRARTSVARPEGSEHALPTIVIEGVEELVEALRAA